MATHSRILAWIIPQTEETGGLPVHRVTKSRSQLKQMNTHTHTHTIKDFSIVNEAEVDFFPELPCFFYDPTDVDNLISGSSAFSKSSLYIWKFLVHVLLKLGLMDFENYLTGM